RFSRDWSSDVCSSDLDQKRHGPENKLLTGIVFADFRQLFLIAGNHVIGLRQPLAVLALPQIGAPEAQEKAEKAEEQDNADPWMEIGRASGRANGEIGE